MSTSVAFKQKSLFRAVPGLFSQRRLFNPATPFDNISVAQQTLEAILDSLGGSLWIAGQQCFIDSAGTTPAALGDPIGRINDLCGSNYAWQDTTASKPILDLDAGGKAILTFDGTDDFFRTAIQTPEAGYIAGAWAKEAGATINAMFASGVSAGVSGISFRASAAGYLQLTRSDGTATTGATGTVVLGSKYIADGNFASASASVRTNGTNEIASSSTRVPTSTNYFRIGAGGLGGDTQQHYWKGPMLAQLFIPGERPGATVEAEIRRLLAEIAAVSGVV
jgi:hypothetical protein